MNWKDYYHQHSMTAQEAVTRIKSGERVVLAHACSEPAHLVDAMVANAAAYRNVEVMQMVPMGKSEYCAPQYAENFRFNTIFVGAKTRAAVAENRPLPRCIRHAKKDTAAPFWNRGVPFSVFSSPHTGFSSPNSILSNSSTGTGREK